MSVFVSKNQPKMRSGVAVAAMHRNSGGPMRHRLQPRGGARNDMADLIEEYEDERDAPRPTTERGGVAP